MRILLRRGAYVTWCLLTFVVVAANLRLYATSVLPEHANDLPPQIIAQLEANRRSLDSGAAPQMQQLFPEGYYFSYVWHGLTWVEVGLRDTSLRRKAIKEARWCLEHLESESGRAAFPNSLPPRHGMFYSAWMNALRSGVVLLQKGSQGQDLNRLRTDCDEVARLLTEGGTPFPPSYHNQAWPCDTLPAIHAMAIYDSVTGEQRYQRVIDSWRKQVDERLDPATGLLPHFVNPRTGHDGSVARSTSQMIILRFLADAAPDLARSQYEIYREQFLTTFCGIPCVWEYPTGTSGTGDVDSGPLIFGRCLPATVMMTGIARMYGDTEIAVSIGQAGETVGLPWTTAHGKTYVGNALPIGSMIVTWSQTARPWLGGRSHRASKPHQGSMMWRVPVHLWSSLLFVPFLIRYRRDRNRRRAKESQAPQTSTTPWQKS